MMKVGALTLTHPTKNVMPISVGRVSAPALTAAHLPDAHKKTLYGERVHEGANLMTRAAETPASAGLAGF